MTTFEASNGVEITFDTGGYIEYATPGEDGYAEGLDAEVVEALREFFRSEKDEELGRWRDAKMPGFVLENWASHLGLRNNEEALEAMTTGARFLAHGFTGPEMDLMIQKHYAAEAAKLGITSSDIAALDLLGMERIAAENQSDVPAVIGMDHATSDADCYYVPGSTFGAGFCHTHGEDH